MEAEKKFYTLAEFAYGGDNTNDTVAGQAYDPVTGTVRILVGFVPILMSGGTGLAENGE